MLIVWTAVSYLIGCLNAAYYLHRLRTGADIRRTGSGNAGARNAGRVLGWRAFLAVFLFDAGKGALASWGAIRLGLGDTGAAAACVAVVAGHIWPVQLRFKGGKGIATAFGSVLAIDYRIAFFALAVAGLFLVILKRPALSGVLAVLLSPVIAAAFGATLPIVAGLIAAAFAVALSHRAEVDSLWRDKVQSR